MSKPTGEEDYFSMVDKRHPTTPCKAEPPGLAALRSRAGWPEAIEKLNDMWHVHGEHARQRAEEITSYHKGLRGLMVVDVVLSKQRHYDSRVSPLLERWSNETLAAGGDRSLAWLAAHPLTSPSYPLRKNESTTITEAALGLLRFATERDLDEDDACVGWAASVEGLEITPKLDPYVGAVTGIGPALFAYTRMLCGADTIKPDVRVIRELQALGVSLPLGDAVSGFVAAACLAHELQISLLELDQLLWYARDRR